MPLLQDALNHRYGPRHAPTLHTALPGDDVLQALLGHASVRGFLPQALADGTLERLLAAAQSAATSSNLQAWSVVAVESNERKARLAEWAGHQAHVAAAPLLLVWLADLSRLDRVARRQGLEAGANRYLEQLLVGVIDAALAAQNAVVAAEAMGLGTVYIGGLRNRVDLVARELQLPARVFPVFGLCVGHPASPKPHRIRPRLPQGVVLHRESYTPTEAADTEEPAIAAYDATLNAFQHGQGRGTPPWTHQAAQRVAGPGSLSGRDVLRDRLKTMGFEME